MKKSIFWLGGFVLLGGILPFQSALAVSVTSGPQAVNVVGNGAQITWTTDIASDSMVNYGTSAGAYPYSSSNRCDGGGNVTSHCINLMSLAYSITYYYKVFSGSVDAVGQFTSAASSGGGGGGSVPAVPAAPSGLSSNPIPTASAVYLQWNDNSSNEDKFNIERSLSGANSWTLIVQITTANTTNYTDSTVSAATSYDYRVQACLSGYGCSEYTYVYGLSTPTASGSGGSSGTIGGGTIGGGTSGGISSFGDATLYGKVLDSSGAVVANASLGLYAPDNSVSYGASSDSQGAYFIRNVLAGSYKLQVWPPYGLTGLVNPPTIDITLGSGKTVNKDLVFSKASKTIKGKVSDFAGGAVKDATVYASKKDTASYLQTQTDSEGKYALLVSGGSWEASVYSQSQTASWIYNKPPQSVVFGQDSTVEEKILDFIVVFADASVKGKILKPDGTAPAPNAVSINFQSSDGFGFGGPVDGSGGFSVKLPAGAYSVFIQSQDTSLIGPKVQDITLAKGEIKDLGELKLLKPSKVIKGRVTKEDGSGVADAFINAFNQDTKLSVGVQADAGGNFSFSVTGGLWEIHVHSVKQQGEEAWIYSQPSQSISFANDTNPEEKIIDFKVTSTDTTVSGKVLRPEGIAPAADTTFISFNRTDGFGYGAPLSSDGAFRVRLPAGSYNVFVQSKESGFVAPDVPQVTLKSGETKDIGTIYLIKATKLIKGKIRRQDGSGVADAVVSAFKRDAQGQVEAQVNSFGEYSIYLAGGFWEVAPHPLSEAASWTYNQPPQSVVFAQDNTSEEKVIDFNVVTADVTIKGKILKPDGAPPVQNTVFISIELEGAATFSAPSQVGFGAPLDSAGEFTAKIPAGTYIPSIHVQVQGLISPKLASFTVVSGQTKDFGTITLLKATKTIKGKVLRSDGRAVNDAFVGANRIDGKGSSVQVQTDSAGSYTLLVGGGLWEAYIFPVVKTADWVYVSPPNSILFSDDVSPEEKIINFTVVSADATIKGKILKPDGSAPPVDTVFIGFQGQTGFGGGAPVESGGVFSARVPAGTYNVVVHSQNNELAAPDIPAVTVATGETKDLGTITLIKATKFIKGKVTRADGRGIANAFVSVFRKETQNWIDTKTDSSGNYSLQLLGGTWEVNLHPDFAISDWIYAQPPQVVAFVADSSVEEKTINFTVVSADATIKGKVLRPDGAPPTPGTVFIGFRSSAGIESGGPVDGSGNFLVRVVAGTYQAFINSQDPKLSSPDLSPATVAIGETKDIGEIKLITRSDRIKGKVADRDGKAISGVFVDAYQPDKAGYANSKTNANGEFELFVTPGIWEVIARPDPSLKYFSAEPPRKIEIISGVVSTVNFTLLPADSTLSGQVVDEKGNFLSDIFGFVGLSERVEFGPGLGGPVDRGTFLIPAPSGSYTASLFLPPESPYTSGAPQTVKLEPGKTTDIKISVSKNSSQIIGSITDEAGKAIVGFKARVFATSKSGAWQEAAMDAATGKYVLRVAPGIWYLGYEIDPASGFISAQQPTVEVVVGIDAAVTKNLVVKKAGSIISGQVTDPSGKGLAHVFLAVSQTGFAGAFEAGAEEAFKSVFVAGGETDANGFYKVAAPAGSYFVKTFVNPGQGFINAHEQQITIAEGETKTANFQMLKAELRIEGMVLFGEKPIADSFVWGWSERGGYQESFSRSDGSFVLNITASTTWRIAASKEINGEFYKSSEISINVGSTTIKQDVVLRKVSSAPQTKVQSADAAKPMVVSVPDGPTIVAPASAVSGGGSVSISISPDARVASQGEVKVVGLAFNIEARDEQRQVVSNLNSSVTITLPYTEKDVAQLGVKESELTVGFWEDTASTWKPLENCMVNDAENNVTCSTSHLTRFAIVAAADITPPAAPSSVKAEAAGKGLVRLAWVNPAKDFNHAKIYRSETKNELGAVVFAEVQARTKTDSGLKDGVTYFYTVRAVDPAGNESANTDKVSVKVAGTSEKAKEVAKVLVKPEVLEKKEISKVEFKSALGRGSKGSEVQALQKILIAEGFLAAGLDTGFFGPATETALKKLQEKLDVEAVGFVGPKTRVKLNELFGVAEEKKVLPPGQQLKIEILRSLSQGSSGDEVKALQEILIKEGVYPEGIITGFFGNLTKQAVIRFQEKYVYEILAPAGLQSGTGFVGPSTRKKLNELLGETAKALTPVLPAATTTATSTAQ